MNLETMTEEQVEEYRAICEGRSAAEYRFRRDLCGLTHYEVSRAIGCREDTAKRFENPRRGGKPSIEAWAFVDSAYERVMRAAEEAVRIVEEAEEHGEPGKVKVTYRRDGMPTRDGEPMGEANGASLAAIVTLRMLGYEVEVDWPEEVLASIAPR